MNKFYKLAVLLFLALLCNPAGTAFASVNYGWGAITEVAFDESQGYNFIEIFVLEDTNIGGAKLHHRSNLPSSVFTHAFTFPNLDVDEGDILILEFLHSSTAAHTTESFGYVFYTTYSAVSARIASTQGAFILTEPDGTTWSDAMLFIAPRASTFNMEDKYDLLSANGFWSPTPEAGWSKDDYRDATAVGGSGAKNYSIQRKNNLVTGHPILDNSANGWEVRRTTRGGGYYSGPTVEKVLQINNSPFFPRGDGDVSFAQISILNTSDKTLQATVNIFNTSGYSIRKLVNYENINSESFVTYAWDGTDDYGETLPMGVYIVHLKLEDGSGGAAKHEQAPIVIGRK